MGKILKADNRSLTQGQKYSYLTTNYTSGQSSVVVENSLGYVADDFVILSEFGSETSEIMQIQSVTASTHTITFTATTKFGHAESTKLTIIPFNQWKFYHCASVVNIGSIVNSTLLSAENVQADDVFSKYSDTSNSTGFAWIMPYNSTTSTAGSIGNAIPYAGFSETNAKYVIDMFLSQINNKEKKLISNTDLFGWLTEAYSIVRRQFNLVTRTDEVKTQSITPSARETSLNSDFFKIVRVYNETDDCNLRPIEIKELEENDDLSGSTERYYTRREDGINYLGISPTPTSASKTYTVWYESKSPRITSYYDFIYIPDDSIYLLVNYMIYKASPKLGRGNGSDARALFFDDMKRMKEESMLKIESGSDKWEPDDSINI